MKKYFLLLLLVLPFSVASAQGTLLQDKIEYVKAKVVKVESSENRTVPGTDVQSIYQKIKAQILEGDSKGNTINIENDYLKLNERDTFYAMHTIPGDGRAEYWSVKDPYRLNSILIFLILFIVITVIFGGMQGVRALITLGGSLALIVYVLLPSILHGHSPVILSMGVASLIIILGSYITHGFNKTTSSAVIGMIVTIFITGALAFLAVHSTHLSGYESEESVYLNFDTRGSIDFVGLLLGGIMIGLLGVLYDAAIGQAVAVAELHHVAPHLPRKYIFKRAIRIGREHIGALVNTLAIAYVGASLPLLLLFYTSQSNIAVTINQEIFSTEIVRTLIGSMGLILAVPITTLIASLMLVKPKKAVDAAILNKEEHELAHYEHHH